MEENQYILKPEGILDRGFAISLIHELDVRRRARLTVDASGIVRALHEGIEEILHAEQAGDLPVSEWTGLSEEMAVLFQLNGIPVSRRSAILGTRNLLPGAGPGPDEALDHAGSSADIPHHAFAVVEALPDGTSGQAEKTVVTCRRCEARLALRPPGLFACPSCGVRFYADLTGRIVPYEPIHS